jgi:hypothetical protein
LISLGLFPHGRTVALKTCVVQPTSGSRDHATIMITFLDALIATRRKRARTLGRLDCFVMIGERGLAPYTFIFLRRHCAPVRCSR